MFVWSAACCNLSVRCAAAPVRHAALYKTFQFPRFPWATTTTTARGARRGRRWRRRRGPSWGRSAPRRWRPTGGYESLGPQKRLIKLVNVPCTVAAPANSRPQARVAFADSRRMGGTSHHFAIFPPRAGDVDEACICSSALDNTLWSQRCALSRFEAAAADGDGPPSVQRLSPAGLLRWSEGRTLLSRFSVDVGDADVGCWLWPPQAALHSGSPWPCHATCTPRINM